jgi:1-deoxy-D-xylulose-5-phosphate synthase
LDGVKVGGVGTRIRQDLRDAQIDTALTELGLPDEFLEHATRDEILERVGLTAPAIASQIAQQVAGLRVPHARQN